MRTQEYEGEAEFVTFYSRVIFQCIARADYFFSTHVSFHEDTCVFTRLTELARVRIGREEEANKVIKKRYIFK